MLEPLKKLQELMLARNIDAYLVPTSDFHASEYVGEYFKAREYCSGFTGSAGTLVVTRQEAGLWTDGRYFLQAEVQLAGSGITLYKMDMPGVPTIEAFLLERLPFNGVLGADGRTLTAAMRDEIIHALKPKKAVFYGEEDLVGLIWEHRPPLPQAPAFALPEAYTGETAAQKLSVLRQEMDRLGACSFLLSKLEDICWLFNFRGGDIPYNPLVLCYALIEQNQAWLFVDQAKLPQEIIQSLQALGVTLAPYDSIYDFLKERLPESPVLLNRETLNAALYDLLLGQTIILDRPNPTEGMKAAKNPVELANLRQAHVKDGVVMVKFIHWLKTRVGKEPITEVCAAQRLDALRCEQTGCIGPSFTTIAGYGPHAAIVHYQATPQSDIPLQPEGFLLVDSGGQYLEGTTDITRTIALGPLTEEQRKHFTLVLQGMLRLSHAKFPSGMLGTQLDILARQPLWEQGLDYPHGTGHGVGYLLCVHEGPLSIRWRPRGQGDLTPLMPGIVLSDEPGVYFAGAYGIRTENLLAVQPAGQINGWDFLSFETLTLAPIDLDGIEPQLLSAQERAWLNEYHARVFATLSPLLTDEEAAWLKQATREI